MSPATDISKRNNAARRRGTSWEVEVTNGFREHGIFIDRTRNTGAKDEGDHAAVLGNDVYVIEAKNRSKFEPQAWVREAVEEAENYRLRRGFYPDTVHPAVCMKVRGKGFSGSIVLLPVAEYIRLLKQAHNVDPV